jgi:hypothetical protein
VAATAASAGGVTVPFWIPGLAGPGRGAVAELRGFEALPPRGEYLAREDETPALIAGRFGLDVQAVVGMNRDMYPGLHPRARFKNGTLVLLPAPAAAALGRPALQPAAAALADLLGLIRAELALQPLSHRLQAAAAHWADCAGRYPGACGVGELAGATLQLERCLLVPNQVALPCGGGQSDARGWW